MDRLLSVVVSVYNEEKALEDFYKETTGILKDFDWAYELIFVNDGSSDQSLAILERLSASDRAVKVVSFSRNFGHEAAMIAGLDYSSGDGIICMDADLQHPPECIPVILNRMSRSSLHPTRHGRFCPFPMWRRPVPEAASTPLP